MTDEPTPPPAPRPAPRGSRLGLRKRRRLVAELAALPPGQSVAFLGRELDNRSYVSIAAQLGVSETASRILVVRARERLIGLEHARRSECVNVRVGLEEAHHRSARPTPQVREHLIDCDDCKRYQRSIDRMDGRLSKLEPGIGSSALAGASRVVGGGGPAFVIAKSVVAFAAIVAVIGGGVLIATHKSTPPDPPIEVTHLTNLSSRHLLHGKPLPQGDALVRAHIMIPAGRRNATGTVTMTCPSGTGYVSIVSGSSDSRVKVHTASGTARGSRGTLSFTVTAPTLSTPTTITTTILCSQSAKPKPKPKPKPVPKPKPKPKAAAVVHEHLCAPRVIFTTAPGGPYRGILFRGQTVTRLTTKHRFVRITAPSGATGWALTSQISRGGSC